jgi:hypothetical protein
MEPENNSNRRKTIIYDGSYTIIVAGILIPNLIYYFKMNNKLRKTTIAVCLIIMIIFGIIELIIMIFKLLHHLINYNKVEDTDFKNSTLGLHSLCFVGVYSMMIKISLEILYNTKVLYRYDVNIRGFLLFILSSTLLSWFIAAFMVILLFTIAIKESQEHIQAQERKRKHESEIAEAELIVVV